MSTFFFIFINIRPRIDLSRQQGEVIKDEIIEEELYPIIARSITFFCQTGKGTKGGASKAQAIKRLVDGPLT